MSIYLDNNATTALDAQVLDAMLPYMQQHFGNPSSVHRFGRTTKAAIERAREQVGALVGAHPSQVTFTACGTEANNWVVKSVAKTKQRLLVSAIEHASLLAAAQAQLKQGSELELLPVTTAGVFCAQSLEKALQKPVDLISLMLANNETGVIQPLADMVKLCRKLQPHAPIHTDACQAAGKISVDFNSLDVQFMSLSAHKLYGPLGAGALISDKTVALEPLLSGGGQERGLRSGTENTAAIVGFGKAAELALAKLKNRTAHAAQLKQQLERGLSSIDKVTIFAKDSHRLPNTVQFSLAGFHGETTLMKLDCKNIAVSSGSACDADKVEPSHVLLAMGIDEQTALGAIRVSIGKHNTQQEIEQLINAIAQIAAGGDNCSPNLIATNSR